MALAAGRRPRRAAPVLTLDWACVDIGHGQKASVGPRGPVFGVFGCRSRDRCADGVEIGTGRVFGEKVMVFWLAQHVLDIGLLWCHHGVV